MRKLVCLICCAVAAPALADQQMIAPGTGRQSTVVISTGANGLCETTAASGDSQSAPVGGATPNRNEIKCGANKLVDTVAAGDDVQLFAVGAPCSSVNTIIIDTGEDGIPDTVPVGDDVYNGTIAFGVPPSNSVCVGAGADGIAQTATLTGDDVRVTSAGAATPNTDVILCGPNLIVDTSANNLGAGDDVQLIPLGGACTDGQVVVNSGPDGIATTRADGPDLLMRSVKPVKLTINAGSAFGVKTIKFLLANVENGPNAAGSRVFRLSASSGSCPGGTVTQIDADALSPGLQATAVLARGGIAKATAVAKVKLESLTTAERNAPYRCTFDVSVVAIDTAPAVDDAANPENNTVRVDLEVLDRNDLQ
jgi:hypothetical protein